MKLIFEQANAKAKSGDLIGAVTLLKTATNTFPNSDDLNYRIGMLYARMGNFNPSIEFLEKAILLNALSPEIHYNFGLVLSMAGYPERALAAYQKALKLAPEDIDTLVNISGVLNELSAYEEALTIAKKAIKLDDSVPQAWFNKATALKRLKLMDRSLAAYNNCLQLNPGYAEAWADKGQVLAEIGQHGDAISHFDRSLEIDPYLFVALKDKGDSLHSLFKLDLAIDAYQSALKLKPEFEDAWNNLGVALQDINEVERAINAYRATLKINSNHVDAWNNLGAALQSIGDLDGSLIAYQKVLEIDPGYPFAYGSYCFHRLSTCNWDGIESEILKLEDLVVSGVEVVHPFFMLSMSHDESKVLTAARTWSAAHFPQKCGVGKAGIKRKEAPIRLGYFSADFRLHAVAHLISGLLETHDKDQFEVYGFAYGPKAQDDASSRIAKALHGFIDIRSMSDEDVAKLAKELEIDIAIDLTGLTQYSRPGIFIKRAAAIQVNYLGYPGTVGYEAMDYLIADATILPAEHQQNYIEKIVYLPDCYQANDSKREIAEVSLSRGDVGLPESGFIFCCFNNLYKITPSTFDVWMRILKRVDGSVLWLLDGNPTAVKNLKREARKRGVEESCLIFAPRETLSIHLARHRLADLFIDSLPYGAHTTASDALWAGLPVLTCLGESFVGKVAASLLGAVKLPELITKNYDEFEEMAVDLAHNPEKLGAFKKRLEENKLTAPLFDTQLFTRNIESAYKRMMERHCLGLPPDHLYIQFSDT